MNTVAYIKDTTGEVVSRRALIDKANSMDIRVSKKTISEQRRLANLSRLSAKQQHESNIVARYYRNNGSAYVANLTGLTRRQVVARANRMGIHLDTKLVKNPIKKDIPKLPKKQQVTKAVVKNKQRGVTKPIDLSYLECLALYLPWRTSVHKLKKKVI